MRNVGREVSGAWHSLPYDRSRRPADDATTELGLLEYEPEPRPRRQVLAATMSGVLSLVGAAGAYFVVVIGLGALTGQDTAQPDQPPAVVDAPSPSPTALGATIVPSPAPSRTVPSPAGGAAPRSTGRAVLGRAPVRPAPSPTCACVTPPVPTRTSPPPPVTRTPDTPVTSSPPAPTISASPEPTPEPSDPPPAGA